MFDLLGGHGKVTQILEPRKAFAGSKPTSNFLPCGSRLPLTTKRRPTIALLSKLRRPLNVIHGNDRFTKFNKARGNSPVATDLMGNFIDFTCIALAGPLPLIQENKLKAVAVATKKRSALLPDVPTVRELGLGDIDEGSRYIL